MDYRIEDDIKSEIIQENICKDNKINIEVVYLDGYIYRGDPHNNLILSTVPRFYGTQESAQKYFNSYVKKYHTKRKLKLLYVGSSNENKRMLLDMIKCMIKNNNDDDKDVLESMYIVIQVIYGVIIDKFSNIDTLGLSDDEISEKLDKSCKTLDYMYDESIEYIEMLLDMIEYYKTRDDIKPSRVGIRYLDKLLMEMLMKIFTKYDYDGIYLNNGKMTETHLCYHVNNEYYNKKITNTLTCIPSEMTIWNPQRDLDIVEMKKYENGKVIKQDIEYLKRMENYKKKLRRS